MVQYLKQEFFRFHIPSKDLERAPATVGSISLTRIHLVESSE